MLLRFLTFRLACLLLAMAATLSHAADDSGATLRVGVLQFGTVNWELNVVQANKLAQKRGLNLKIVPLASGDASTVALQGGAVDVIVSDWIWVTRQRADGMNVTFAPYSNAVGSVMVKADGSIRSVADLKGKSIGVSGGPYDKTWLLLRAYANKKLGLDLAGATRPVFAAPPLLNELALSGQVDAALNVWHYDARLEANGMRALIKLPEILAGLGVDKPIPLIGWVFREDWANQNRDAMEHFLAASQEAKGILARSDAEWERLKPLMHAEDNATFVALKTGYRNGIPTCESADAQSNVAAVFKVLAETGGDKLVGKSRVLSEGTFWNGFKLPACPKN
jgi:NitT/TauT family transport system substrate-binding protein